MNKKVILNICILLMFLMPIISIEDIVIWIVALYFIHRSIKKFRGNTQLKPVIINTVVCSVIIVSYNVIVRYIEEILVKLWL